MREVTRRDSSPKRTTSNKWYIRKQSTPEKTKRDSDLLPRLSKLQRQSKDIDKKRNFELTEAYRRIGQLEDFDLRHKVGEGAFAQVYSASDKKDGRRVIVKSYERAKLYDKQRKTNIKNQIAILSRIMHPHIIQLITVIENQKSINLVMEHFSEKTLRKITSERKLTEDETKKVIKQLADALDYLHRQNIAHRDIKLENILVDEHFNIKLIDFGFAVECSEMCQSSMVGTPNYLCPEILNEKHYNPFKADIWSIGILLYFLQMGYFPFRGDCKVLHKKIVKGELEFPVDINPGSEYLIRKMLNPSYEQRVDASDIIKDTWIRPINFKDQIMLLERVMRSKA